MKCQKCRKAWIYHQQLGSISTYLHCQECGFEGYQLYQEIGEEVGSEKATKKRTKKGKISTLTVFYLAMGYKANRTPKNALNLDLDFLQEN